MEIFGQLVLATVLGALVGLERQLSKKSAGMRTFALVSLGAAFFTIISILAGEKFSLELYNIALIPSQIVLGVGFIGAGLIIFHGSHLRGLTTAAGLWVSAAIGVSIGFGFYSLAIFATILIILVFVVFWFIEEKITKKFVEPPEQEK
jgi:putative Mg2+ transporter-C (MgtC) family protein